MPNQRLLDKRCPDEYHGHPVCLDVFAGCRYMNDSQLPIDKREDQTCHFVIRSQVDFNS